MPIFGFCINIWSQLSKLALLIVCFVPNFDIQTGSKLWDKQNLGEPDAMMASDGKRRLVAPDWRQLDPGQCTEPFFGLGLRRVTHARVGWPV
jgi:hypothetical protein